MTAILIVVIAIVDKFNTMKADKIEERPLSAFRKKTFLNLVVFMLFYVTYCVV